MRVFRFFKTTLPAALFILITGPGVAHAGQMSTYIKGMIVKKTPDIWVVQTRRGVYWISVLRSPSHSSRYSAIESGFWVQTRDIIKFRPNVERASLD